MGASRSRLCMAVTCRAPLAGFGGDVCLRGGSSGSDSSLVSSGLLSTSSTTQETQALLLLYKVFTISRSVFSTPSETWRQMGIRTTANAHTSPPS